MSEDLSPQETRARLERSYADSYKHAGLPVDKDAVSRLVVADLELVDRARAMGELSNSGPPAPAVEREKPEEITRAEAETGTRLVGEGDDQGERVIIPELDHRMTLTSEKWAKAGGRIARVLEGMVPALDYRAAVKTAAMPLLALEYAETYSYFMTRGRPAPVGQTDHNPFRYLSDADAGRKLVAKVYDICDRTTGAMGSWYLK